MKSLTNYENPSSNPRQEASSGFQVTNCDSKSCSKIILRFWKLFQKANYDYVQYTRENQIMTAKESKNRKFWFLELVRIFNEGSRNFFIIFLLLMAV